MTSASAHKHSTCIVGVLIALGLYGVFNFVVSVSPMVAYGPRMLQPHPPPLGEFKTDSPSVQRDKNSHDGNEVVDSAQNSTGVERGSRKDHDHEARESTSAEDDNKAHLTEAFLERFHKDGTCRRGWQSAACYDDVVRLAGRRKQNGTVTIVVVAYGSYDIVLNWCISMKRIRLDNYILVALEEEAHSFFMQKRAPIIRLGNVQENRRMSRNDVWIRRTLVAYTILRAGIDVLISDADAVMMRSPFANPSLFFVSDSFDIVSSPSNFPNPSRGELPASCSSRRRQSMKWRHQPCMGWILLRSSQRMVDFFTQRLLRDVIHYDDDQIGLNCAIRKAGAMWRDGNDWRMSKAMVTTTASPKLNLVLLPGSRFVRNCTEFVEDKERGYGIYQFKPSDVRMYHCKGKNKKENAANNGFWYLRDDWNSRTSTAASSYDGFLSSVSKITLAKTQ